LAGGVFPDTGWDPNLRAATFAAEFTTRNLWSVHTDPGHWHSGRYRDDLCPSEKEATADLETELAALWDYLVEERNSRDDEIARQCNDFHLYWGNLMVCSPVIRPYIWLLIHAALQTAGLVVAYHKHRYARPRPAQIWAPIAPTIATPGHAAYPSGHASQTFLIAECMKLIAPEMGAICDTLASRIAENREVAGVHYRSDSLAGRWTARQIMKLQCGWDPHKKLPETPDVDALPNTSFGKLVRAARNEWRLLGNPPLNSDDAPAPHPTQTAHIPGTTIDAARILAKAKTSQ